MRSFLAISILAGVVVFLSGRTEVVADSIALPAVKDSTLIQDNAGSLSNGSGSYFFAGRTGQSDAASRRRGLIAFDLSAIPPGSTVTAASLTLFMSRTPSSSESVSLHRLLADWGEGTSNAGGQEGSGAPVTPGDATWLHRFFPGVLWTNPGGDFSAAPSAIQTIDFLGFYTWSSTVPLVSDVQGWVNQPNSNFGWLVLGAEDSEATAKRFESRTGSIADRRPQLVVEYTPGPAACCLPNRSCVDVVPADCTAQGGTSGAPGSICLGDPDGDGIDTSCGDNCPSAANPGQEDVDLDGQGNACDCGDGLVTAPEQCEGGVCCTPQCLFVSAGILCRGSAGVCDTSEACTGSSESCPPDGYAGASTICRPANGPCDVAESCTGDDPNCPPDGFASGGVCRPAQGDCDVAESCNGSGIDCPPNGFASGTVCRPSTGDCDPAELCDGLSVACPANVVITACMKNDGCCPTGCTHADDPDCPATAIPTVSGWGLVTLSLLFLVGAKLRWRRRVPVSAGAPNHGFANHS